MDDQDLNPNPAPAPSSDPNDVSPAAPANENISDSATLSARIEAMRESGQIAQERQAEDQEARTDAVADAQEAGRAVQDQGAQQIADSQAAEIAEARKQAPATDLNAAKAAAGRQQTERPYPFDPGISATLADDQTDEQRAHAQGEHIAMIQNTPSQQIAQPRTSAEPSQTETIQPQHVGSGTPVGSPQPVVPGVEKQSSLPVPEVRKADEDS